MTHNNNQDKLAINNGNQPASDKSISRLEFVRLVIKRGAVAGAILAVPQILDTFVVPPLAASASTTHGHAG